MRISVEKQNMLSHDRLVSLLDYDKKTGIFRWRVTRNGRALAGADAGNMDGSGYLMVTIDRAKYLAHRLAWFWVRGEWPSTEVDHKDLHRSNNRWRNLRLATESQNRHHTALRKSNTSGVTGVHWHVRKARWVARIRTKDGRVDLGDFIDKEDAAAAYRSAAKKHYGEFARST